MQSCERTDYSPLDSLQGVLKGGGRGSALMPGVPVKSLLIQAIHYQSSPKMPPSGPLSDADQRTLEDWVKMGAPWPGAKVSKETLKAAQSGGYVITPAQKSFWSFIPVHRPSQPKTPPIFDARGRSFLARSERSARYPRPASM